MARIRTVKPEFWTSEQIVECSTTARLLFIGLWNFCDDSGVHPATAKSLKMKVFPADDFSVAQINAWIDELINAGLISKFTSDNVEYWAVKGWHHQKIDRPAFKYPKPPKFDEHSTSIRRVLDEQTANATPRKGREGIVKDVDVEQPPSPTFPASAVTPPQPQVDKQYYRDLWKQLIRDERNTETMLKIHRITDQQYKYHIEQFCLLQINEDKVWANYKDFRQHFQNWLRIQGDKIREALPEVPESQRKKFLLAADDFYNSRMSTADRLGMPVEVSSDAFVIEGEEEDDE